MPCCWRSSVACVLCTSMPSMWTGPVVSSRTRLAMRNASTTPWQYPRGVILTTSISIRVYARGLVDPCEDIALGQRRTGFAALELVVLGSKHHLVDLVGHGREPRVGVA